MLVKVPVDFTEENNSENISTQETACYCVSLSHSITVCLQITGFQINGNRRKILVCLQSMSHYSTVEERRNII